MHLTCDYISYDTDPVETHEKTRSRAGLPEPVRPNATPRVRTGGPCPPQGSRPVPGEAGRAGGVRPAVDQPGGERRVLALAGPGVPARQRARRRPGRPVRRPGEARTTD